jgi:hypothetical protein
MHYFHVRLFRNNLGCFVYKLKIFSLNFIRKENDKSEFFSRNPINTFLTNLWFFLTGKVNLGGGGAFPASGGWGPAWLSRLPRDSLRRRRAAARRRWWGATRSSGDVTKAHGDGLGADGQC